MKSKPARTRIAPSPTGDPHVGTGYMGLVNRVLATQTGGQFVLRIDDTDRTRYREGSEEAIFEALRWLGLEWDEGPDKGGPHGPYRQSERSEIYATHIQLLLEKEEAYRCFCSEDDLTAMRARQQEAKERTRYDRTCRELPAAAGAKRADAGEAHVVRLKMPLEGSIVVQDMLRGAIELKQDNFQDQVLMKRDGFPTYHLASCVDDHLMAITHIIRAEEWISSAATHKRIFEAFGWEMPVLCHMPLLRNPDKSKISKRNSPTSLLYYRDAGFLPEALVNFLGLMGWGGPKEADGTNREQFSVADMIEHFRLETLSLGGPVFDRDKLLHINATYLRQQDPLAFARGAVEFWRTTDEERLSALGALAIERTRTYGEFLDVVSPFLGEIHHHTAETRKNKDPKQRELIAGLVPKKLEPDDAWFALNQLQGGLDQLQDWEAEAIEAVCRGMATKAKTGWKARDLFMSLRVGVLGRAETPPLFESMVVLGKPLCMGRITDALRAIGEPGKKKKKRYEKEQRAREAEAAAALAVDPNQS